MRVRPIFWFVFGLCCMGVFIFAGVYQLRAPLVFHIARQHLVSQGPATLELHVTDPQGLPIDQARVVPGAHMTNMDMLTREVSVLARGNGVYLVQLQFTMAGPWAIIISASAEGFAPVEQTMHVEVT